MSDTLATPDTSSASQPATPAAPPATATPVATASPATPATPPAAPAAPAPDNRDGWVPSYRVRETREAAMREAQSQFAQRESQYQAQLAQIQSQLHALVGVNPPANPEVAAVRDQFGRLYPGLNSLEAKAQQLESLLERAGDLESQTTHYWQTYGRQTMDRLMDHASKTLGSPLTEEGKRALHSAFTGFVSSSPELTARYANDPSIVEDFWQVFSSSFIDPARRAASGAVATRAAGVPLPQDTPAGVPVSQAPKPANLDERTAMAWSVYNQSKG